MSRIPVDRISSSLTSERWSKLQEVPCGFAAQADIETEDEILPCAEAEANAVVGFEPADLQIFDTRRNHPGVKKQRHVERGKDLIAILCIEQEQVAIREAPLSES